MLFIQLTPSSTDGQNHLLDFFLMGLVIMIQSTVVTHPCATALAFRRVRMGSQGNEVLDINTNPWRARNAHHIQ